VIHRLTVLSLLGLLLLPGIARADGAVYLVIAPDEYVAALEPLIEWKTLKGVPAITVPTSETGYSTLEIHDYIADAAATWEPAPQYVLIVGDMNTIPMPTLQGGYSDTYYGDTDGDTFIEVHPGRFPAEDLAQVELMVEKTLRYERHPTNDDAYYRSALLTIAEDWDDDDWVHYYGDANWEAGLLTRHGFDNVQILTGGTTPDPTGTAVDVLEAGVAYAGFHGQIGGTAGWRYFEFAPADVANGPMLPVVPTYTCQTIAGASYGGEQWMRAGTAAEPRGGVAFVGQTISCGGCAHWRSSLRRGFWGYLLEDTSDTEILTLAAAVEAGRLHYYQEILSTQQYVASNLLGDPELELWTGVPERIDVSHPPTVPADIVSFSVFTSDDGVPRPDVRVCVSGFVSEYAHGTTDAAGRVTFEVNATAETVLRVVATGRDMEPYEGQILVGTGVPAGSSRRP